MTAITVLVAELPHPVSGRMVRSRSDSVAAALALGVSPEARLLTAGPMSEAVARDYLALGASRVDIMEPTAPSSVTATLREALTGSDWILTGIRQGPEAGEGVLPYALGAALARPVVSDVLAIEADGEAWVVTQAMPRGARRRVRVQAPAILAVSASAPVTLRHSLLAAQSGQIVRQSGFSQESGQAVQRHQRPANKRRKVLEARSQQSGHARMLGAIESPSTGGTVLLNGDARAKAQALLDYLRSHALVHF